MSIYSDKLARVQVIINCQYFVAQMCTHEDKLAHDLGAPRLDDVMSYDSLTIILIEFASYFLRVLRRGVLHQGLTVFSFLKYFNPNIVSLPQVPLLLRQINGKALLCIQDGNLTLHHSSSNSPGQELSNTCQVHHPPTKKPANNR